MRPRAGLLALLFAATLAAAAPKPDNSVTAFDAAIAGAKAAMLAKPADARQRAAAAERIALRQPAGTDRNVRLATAEWLQGEAALRENDVAAAGPIIERALKRIGQAAPTKLTGDLMMSRGGIHAANADVAAALADYQAAYKIFERIGENRSQAIALLCLAGIYREAQDYPTALRYYGQAIDAYSGDPSLAVSTLNNRADVLKELKRYDAALAQFNQALALSQRMDSPLLQARILGNIARLQIDRGDRAAADAAIRRGLTLANSGEAAGWRPQLNGIAADLAFKRGDYAQARTLIERSFAGVPLDQTDVSFREAHYAAYAIYNALGDEPHALAHLRAMKRLDDQIWKLSASTNTALMSARFDSANQEARIAKLKADDAARQLAMAQAETRFQRILFGVLGFGALSVLGLLGFGLYQSRRARIRLSASNTALEKALAAKTEFLATTSHEIRTPLNGILGMTQVMLADGLLDAKLKDRVGIVHGAGLQMRALVDDILDVAKMETGNLTVEAQPFDLKALLEDVTRMWAEQARAKGLTFELNLGDCPRGFIGDSGRVRQMIYNLLSNAVKFTATGSVTVDARCLGDRLRIAVADTGIGIAPEKHGEIFESFKQADGGTTRQFGGTGLGLAIVKNIATALDGSVLVESAAGEGATFIVELPFVAADLAEEEAAAPAGGLLIIDKNPIARAMLKAVLEPRAGRVVFANSCAEGADLLAGITQILVDEATARAEGADPVAAIAGLAERSDARLAVLWSSPDDDVRSALTRAGAIQIVAKPIAGPALASVLYPSNTQEPLVTQAA